MMPDNIYIVIHCNGDGNEVATIGTYSKKEIAKRAIENYIKDECGDYPLGGEYIRIQETQIDRWYLYEKKEQEQS